MADDPAHRHAEMGPGHAGGHARQVVGRGRRGRSPPARRSWTSRPRRSPTSSRARSSGVLRKRVAQDGEVLPVGALLGVVADKTVPDDGDRQLRRRVPGEVRERGKSGRWQRPSRPCVEIGGKRVRYLKLGPDEGTPVLFVHGFGSDHASWLFNHMAAAETRPAYAVDLLGHGGSAKDVGDGTAADPRRLGRGSPRPSRPREGAPRRPFPRRRRRDARRRRRTPLASPRSP